MAQISYEDLSPGLSNVNLINNGITRPYDDWNAARKQVIDALNNAYLQNGVTNAVPYGSPPENNEAWAAGQRAKMADYVTRLPKPSTFAGSGGGTFTGSSGEKTVIPQAGAQNINFWRNNPSGATPAAVESYKQRIMPSQWLTKQSPIQGASPEATTSRDMLSKLPDIQDSIGADNAMAAIKARQDAETNADIMKAQNQAALEKAKFDTMLSLVTKFYTQNTPDQLRKNRDAERKEAGIQAMVNGLWKDGIRDANSFIQWLGTEAQKDLNGQASPLFGSAKVYGDNFSDAWKQDVIGRLAQMQQNPPKEVQPQKSFELSDLMQAVSPEALANVLPQPTQNQPTPQPSQTPTPQPTQAAGPTETARVLPAQAPQAQTQQPQAFSLDTGKVNLIRQMAVKGHPFDSKALASMGWTPQQIEKGQMQYQGLLNRGGK